jgi:hypothetical protein
VGQKNSMIARGNSVFALCGSARTLMVIGGGGRK